MRRCQRRLSIARRVRGRLSTRSVAGAGRLPTSVSPASSALSHGNRIGIKSPYGEFTTYFTVAAVWRGSVQRGCSRNVTLRVAMRIKAQDSDGAAGSAIVGCCSLSEYAGAGHRPAPLSSDKLADPGRGFAKALFVLDQREADGAFAHGAEADAGRYGDVGLLEQLLGELQGT